MSEDFELNPSESVSVQLTRMEGVLNLVGYKVTDLVIRVDRHERDLGELKLSTQQLAADAVARDATVAATAKALREAKEAQDATARAEVSKSERTWSPFTKIFATIAAVATIWAIVSGFIPN